MSDEKSKEVTHQLMEDFYYFTIKNSIRLAKERGKYEYFDGSLWNKGIFPHELYEKYFNEVEKEYGIKLNYEYRRDWEELREELKKYGVRFEFHTSIPPGACQTKDGEIQTENGIKSLKQILEENDIEYAKLEKENIPQWINLKNPFKVKTRFGLKNVERIYFNGKVPVREIEFEDGKKYKFSYNHRLLVKMLDGKEKWIEVKDLKEGMEIVKI